MADELLDANRKDGFIGEVAAKAVLSSVGISVPRGRFALGPEAAAEAANELEGPVALKLVSPDVIHKSDVGAVELGLADGDAVLDAARRMAQAAGAAGWRVDGFLVEEMVLGGHEVAVGGIRDDRFGPLVMVGLGGVLVELVPELAFRLAPISEREAVAMIREVDRLRLLMDGARAGAPLSMTSLIDVLMAIGGEDGLLVREAWRVASVEINPLLLGEGWAVALDARVELRAIGDPVPPHLVPTYEQFQRLFEPATVAVAGASANRTNLANTFIRHLRDYGYPGRIFPIHPSAASIEGLPAFRSLAETPETVDYAYVAVPPAEVAGLVKGAARGLGFIQVVTSGFGETVSGRQRETDVVDAALAVGARLLGPNCLGTHSPRGLLTYLANPSPVRGSVGIVSQSGGLTLDIVSMGRRLGIEFSAVVTIGNSADITPSDLLDFYASDTETRVVGLYLEDVKDGRSFFNTLRRVSMTKPVVLLVGGQTEAGGRAARSHTGALAAGDRVWRGLSSQTGAVLTETLDEFLESLAALQALHPRSDRVASNVVLFGTGGGMSVLATDYFARRGFSVRPLSARTVELLNDLQLPPGSSVTNPVDTPSGTMRAEGGNVAQEIARIVLTTSSDLDALVVHLNLASFLSFTDVTPDLFGNLIRGISDVHRLSGSRSHLMIVFRSSGEAEFDEVQRREIAFARSLGLAAFTRIEGAAHGLAAIRHVERWRQAEL